MCVSRLTGVLRLSLTEHACGTVRVGTFRFPVLHLTTTPSRPEVQKMTAQLHASPCLTQGGVLARYLSPPQFPALRREESAIRRM